MFHNRRKSFYAMGVDTGQYVIWYRIYPFLQIISKKFFSEIDTRSICSDIVSLTSVVVVSWALCVSSKGGKIIREFFVFVFIVEFHGIQ